MFQTRRKVITTIIWENVWTLIDRDETNKRIVKIARITSDGLHVMDIIRPDEVDKRSLSSSTTDGEQSKRVTKLETFALRSKRMRQCSQFTVKSMIKCESYRVKGTPELETGNSELWVRPNRIKQPVAGDLVEN